MFSHLFNTYETVTPPPKSNKDFEEGFYYQPETNIEITDLFNNPVLNIPQVDIPQVDAPSNQPFISNLNWEPTSDVVYNEYNIHNRLVDNIINTGRQLIGGKYRYGGTNPESGLDCSAFLQYIFKQNGVDIPRDTSGIFKTGKEVSLTNAKPGDIICSKGSGKSGRHVQMISRIDPETNQIYVIEAKGEKYGIVEGPLTKKSSDIISVRRIINQNSKDPFLYNQDIKQYRTQRFNNNIEFSNTLNRAYRKALQERGLDPNYSYMLTAQDANETGWGKDIKGNFNYGNITAGEGEAWHNRTGNRKWRDFSSINDYVNAKIDFLSRNRYRFFETFNSNHNVASAMQILANRGYDPGNPNYGQRIQSTYNTLMKYLKG